MAEKVLLEKEPEKEFDHGRGVRFLRETFDISQTGLGEGIGVNQQTISRIEKSKTLPEERIIQIARFFNVPAELIKNFSPEETAHNIISRSKFETKDSSTGAVMIENQTNNNDPKTYEVFEKLLAEKDNVISLKDQLLAEKDKQIAELQKLLKSKT